MFEQLLQSQNKTPTEQQRYGNIQPGMFLIPVIVSLIASLTVNLCMFINRKFIHCLAAKKQKSQEQFPRSPLAGGNGRRYG